MKKMKSTNRQIHFKLNPAKNYSKMCLLNCILISIVTLTHSLPIQTTLSSAIAKHPKYKDTLLNPVVVPFVSECTTDKLKAKQEMLCGSYFEMIEKLDHSNAKGLTTVEDFNKAMNVYNQTKIGDFCVKFPDHIPNDENKYPNSYKLYNHLPKYCDSTLCLDDDLDLAAVKPICRVFAIGFQLSNAEAPVPGNPIPSSTINKLAADGSRNSGSARPDDPSKLQQLSGSVKVDNDKPSADLQIKTNDADAAIKQPVDATVPKAKANEVGEKKPGEKDDGHEVKTDGKEEKIEEHQEKVDGLGKDTAKENSSPNAEAAAAAGSQKGNIGESGAKAIDATGHSKSNHTPTVKQELSPTGKMLIPSENPVETAEKAAGIIKEEESLGDAEIEEDMPKDDDDKTGYKVVTDDPFEDSDMNPKDKLGNPNDDSFENNEEEELLESAGAQPAKSQQGQPPSNEQLPNQEDPFTDDTDSNFFAYFMFLLFVCVTAYVIYHNKAKMLALMLEGRRSNTNGRSGLSRRKHTAAYRKLDSNLEEAITSSGNGRSTQVIY